MLSCAECPVHHQAVQATTHNRKCCCNSAIEHAQLLVYCTVNFCRESTFLHWDWMNPIPCFIVKDCGDILAPILQHIFNLSFKAGIFPRQWKEVIIVPIFKAGDACLVNNYRPGSLLCSFSKVFEIIVHGRLFISAKR